MFVPGLSYGARCAKCRKVFYDEQSRFAGPKGTAFEGEELCGVCRCEVEVDRRNAQRRARQTTG